MIDIDVHKEQLRNLEQNLSVYKESIREVAEEIVRNKVSKYPIFVAAQNEVAVGRMIIDKEDLAFDWNIFASTLEEFVSKGIVKQEKLQFFRTQYKDPLQFICVFAIFDDTAGFIFVSYDA